MIMTECSKHTPCHRYARSMEKQRLFEFKVFTLGEGREGELARQMGNAHDDVLALAKPVVASYRIENVNASLY